MTDMDLTGDHDMVTAITGKPLASYERYVDMLSHVMGNGLALAADRAFLLSLDPSVPLYEAVRHQVRESIRWRFARDIDEIEASGPAVTSSGSLSDAEWREFESMPSGSLTARAWIDLKLAERLVRKVWPATPTVDRTPSPAEVKAWRSDVFDPPLTSAQTEQVQAIINEVVLHAGEGELERLQAWKAEALEVLNAWERVWEAAGRPGRIGRSKAENVRAWIESTRAASSPATRDAVAEVVQRGIDERQPGQLVRESVADALLAAFTIAEKGDDRG